MATPRYPSFQTPEEIEIQQAEPARVEARLLLLEDDELLLEQLTDTLCDAGYQVTAVNSSQQALTWVEREEPLDLVLTDVRMAGIDGIEVFARLRERRPQLRGIIMTGYASPDAPRRAVSAGAWDYLYKPFSELDLLSAVERVLTTEQQQEQHRQSLATRLWAGAQRWFQRILGQSAGHLRERAWWGFHAGVRSRLLERSEALAIYDELERLELSEIDESSLETEYRRVLGLIWGLKTDTLVRYWESPRAPHQVPRDEFDRLFGRVAQGQIPGHLLPLAPALRTLPDNATDQQRADYSAVWL